jgi:hypothetical protein
MRPRDPWRTRWMTTKLTKLLERRGYTDFETFSDGRLKGRFMTTEPGTGRRILGLYRSRVVFWDKLRNRNAFVGIHYQDRWYFYDHDLVLAEVLKTYRLEEGSSFYSSCGYQPGDPGRRILDFLAKYELK